MLKDALLHMRDEGLFRSGSTQLGALMHKSKSHIHWTDYSLVDDARKDRNRVAHDQLILKRGIVWEYVHAIETELVSWQILSTPIPLRH